MMRWTEFAIGHPGAHAAQCDRKAVIGDVDLDLLECTTGQERRGATNERDEAAIGKAGSNPDHVLLRDADIDEPIRKQFLELDEIARADAVVANRDDPFVIPGERNERLREGLTTIEKGCLRGAGG